MKVATKFVSVLKPDQSNQLKHLMDADPSRRVRIRAHTILLSSQGTTVDEIAQIYQAHRNSVSSWIDKWEVSGAEGLYDQPRSGSPPKLNEKEQEVAKDLIKAHPHAPKRVLALLAETTGKTISSSSLRRLAKRDGLRWKRVRKSAKSKRDDQAFAEGEKELKTLKKHQVEELDLFYFDEAGFSLEPCIPYPWQPVGQTIEIPASKGKRLNVLGFFNTDNDLIPFCVEGSVDTDIVIGCFDAFSDTITQKTVVVIDNAPIHKSQAFQKKLPTWEKKGLFLYFLPAYSPELNLIEILWRFIKYFWLPFSAYLNFDALVDAVEEILMNVGTKYQIAFQ